MPRSSAEYPLAQPRTAVRTGNDQIGLLLRGEFKQQNAVRLLANSRNLTVDMYVMTAEVSHHVGNLRIDIVLIYRRDADACRSFEER